MASDSALDLSLRSPTTPTTDTRRMETGTVQILKPTPRPPWSIVWYRNLWPICKNNVTDQEEAGRISTQRDPRVIVYSTVKDEDPRHNPDTTNSSGSSSSISKSEDSLRRVDGESQEKRVQEIMSTQPKVHQGLMVPSIVLDVATCDGPVYFERILNSNFAFRLKHPSNCGGLGGDAHSNQAERTKSHKCIYCNQRFKSQFCYQKHKKRHLNPLSVDMASAHSHNISIKMNTIEAKDLNVQFFPCKRCGCKFPSYYFVHKHNRICHKESLS